MQEISRCLCQFILALLTARTVNLSKLALYCAYKSKRREASYRRLQRFVTRLAIPQEKLAAFVLSLIPGPYVLALDRTNWAFGKTPIHFLVLSVVWRGQGIPLFWKLLPHKGWGGKKHLCGADCLRSRQKGASNHFN